MAQKYLTAFDYVDLQANMILQKHAKKRPLGDIETKHRYTPTQPVLSCRTVDIDVSGTRTYRPKSSADIISEQHAIIHKIYTKARNIVSAPPRRRKKSPVRDSDDNFNKHQAINGTHLNLKTVEVQGRPLTAVSQRPDSTNTGRKSQSSARRPRTTGGITKNNKRNRPPSENFILIKNNTDIVDTKRSYKNLTNKIREQWDPVNHDLNTGIYQRGKKIPDANAAVDSWLTFSGSQAEDAEGIVDAFADPVPAKSRKLETIPETDREYNLDQEGQYYNIEGGVGSRIAQQLQKGDKIRIGINGTVQSQDLKVKQWVKEDNYLIDNGIDESRKNNMVTRNKDFIPLCWADQVQDNGAKVLTPREPPKEKLTLNLCETRPVIFNKLIQDDGTIILEDNMDYSKSQGFRVKQRKKNKPGLDGKERENKVTVVTIDARSEEDEKKIENLSVDEVVKKKSEEKGSKHSNKYSVEFIDSVEVSDGLDVINEPVLQDIVGSQSKVSFSESVSSSGSDMLKHVKVKPTQPTYSKQHSVDLDVVGTLSVPGGSSFSESQSPVIPGSKSPMPPRSAQTRGGSARSLRSREKPQSARSLQHKSSATRSAVSFSSDISFGTDMRSSSAKVGEPEYIKFSQPVKNPNAVTPKRSTDFVTQGQRTTSGIREPVPSPELEMYDEKQPEEKSPPLSPPMRPVSKPTTPALAINIPTAEYTESGQNSPSRRDVQDTDKRANDMRDEQIDQITDLLSGALIEEKDAAEMKQDPS